MDCPLPLGMVKNKVVHLHLSINIQRKFYNCPFTYLFGSTTLSEISYICFEILVEIAEFIYSKQYS